MNSDLAVARARLALEQWFVVAVVALLALSLLGGWATYAAYAGGSGETEPRTVDAWSATGGFDHRAEVSEPNEVYEVGAQLEDRPTYFTGVTPELEGEFRYGYEADSGEVDVDVELERVIRAAEEDDDGGAVEHWSTNETLETATAEGVGPGEETTATFGVDVPAVANETERIEESLGSTPGDVEIVVVAHVTVDGVIDGDPVERTDEYELSIDPGENTYDVDGPANAERTEERTEEVVVSGTSGLVGPIGGLALFFGSLGGLGALSVARSRGALAPSSVELEELRRATEREEFDDWISRGSLPADLEDRSRIEVETLEDLVDVAVDCDRRVIEDGGYYVLDDELLYVYRVDSLEGDGDGDSDGGSDGDGA